MSLQWDESLLVGIEEIDDPHRVIFEQFFKLTEAVQQGKSNEIIEKLANYLLEYAHLHFSAEEKIMVEYKYPNIDEQRHEHEEFKRNANKLKKRLLQEGAKREIAIEAIGKLLRWIIRHIGHLDKEMVAYVKECKHTDQVSFN